MGAGAANMRCTASATLWGCVSVLLIAPLAAWADMALWFRLPVPEWAKAGAAGAFALIAISTVAAVFTRSLWAALLVFRVAFGAGYSDARSHNSGSFWTCSTHGGLRPQSGVRFRTMVS